MAFVFRLNQLLQIAIHEENEVKDRLARKDGQIAELAAKIQKYKDDQENALIQQQQDLLSGDISKVQMYPAYLNMLKKSEIFYSDEMELQQKQREKIMAELLEKQRNRKTYEKLREADEAKYKKQMLKLQQKQLDEFASRKKSSLLEPDNA
ncbi:MAG: flagellar export protein FliJ [Candidatus Riflebacteria bacterium]|jgi:flagellar export protein FliJ|nr:flagellar export protein FliJ [Candidatus Riflebacteria bacterium]